MRHVVRMFAAVCLISGAAAAFAAGGKQSTVVIEGEYPALAAYDKGFALGVMRDTNGVRLFDRVLVQDDGPGAGFSEKGSFLQPVYGAKAARKDLWLEDVRASGAWVAFYVPVRGKGNLRVAINGHETFWDPKSTTNGESCQWLSFDPSWLRKGFNTIVFSYPEGSEKDLWKIMISRGDEFLRGGGDPEHAGENSYASADGGKTWKRGTLGETGNVEGELTVRLSLDRFIAEGWVASPVIDLWRSPDDGLIIPMSIISKMKITASADTPAGATVIWQVRSGGSPDPRSASWGEYRTVGEGASLSHEAGDPGGRFYQWKAILVTNDPRVTPVVRKVTVTRTVTRVDRLPDNIYVLSTENPDILYSSMYGEYEPWNDPKLAILREREKLDKVVAGCKTEFEKMVRLLDYCAKRWVWVSPTPQYPSWDSIEILDRIDKEGGGGMCIHFSILLIQALQAYGIPARLQNCIYHEPVEAWSNDYGKWVFLDPMQGSNVYNYRKKDGEPLGFKELHDVYLDLFYPDRPIDWHTDPLVYRTVTRDAPVGAGTLDKNWPRSSAEDTLFCGLANAAYVRMMPRNDWLARNDPQPLSHGYNHWPWTGYINWYDARTPRFRQHENYTDREADYWPTLNRVKMYAVTGPENDRVFLRFTTFTPNFDTYLVEVDDGAWEPCTEYFPWMLHSGKNTLRVRVKNKLGALGKPSVIEINLADRPNLRERPGGNR